MRQIRNGCFETNSSSSHSIVIRTDEQIKKSESHGINTLDYENSSENIKCYSNKDNTVFFGLYDWYFGRYPFRILDSFVEKFCYLYSTFGADSSVYEEAVVALRELVPENKKIEIPESHGVDEPIISKDWFAINHISVKEFLCSNKYLIICDGDEYNIWSDMRRAGIINVSRNNEEEEE